MIIVCANLRATRVESGRSPEWIARSKPSSTIVVGLSRCGHLDCEVG